MLKRLASSAALALSFALTTGCFGASASMKSGHFFGHDLTQERSVVYVLDLSGSMSGETGNVGEQLGSSAAASATGAITGGLFGSSAGNLAEQNMRRMKKKIEQVKMHLIASLQGLPSQATFNVILFSNGVQHLSPVPLKATGFNTAVVSAFVERLEEGGSTNMYSAMEAALGDEFDHIILLTDGLPTSSTPEEIVALTSTHAAKRTVMVSTVGVGLDQGDAFLETLATRNGGKFTKYD